MRPLEFKPTSVDQLIGHTKLMGQLIMEKATRLRHVGGRFAIVLYGPPGVGKTELAWIVARSMASTTFGIEHLNGQSLSPDKLRDWQSNMPYKPLDGGWTVKLVDEIDSISDGAENALLTFLDRLPNHWAFIATSNRRLQTRAEDKKNIRKDDNGERVIPFRIHSRMQPFQFKEIETPVLTSWLQTHWIPDETAARDIATANEGNVRGALNDADSHLDLEKVLAS